MPPKLMLKKSKLKAAPSLSSKVVLSRPDTRLTLRSQPCGRYHTLGASVQPVTATEEPAALMSNATGTATAIELKASMEPATTALTAFFISKLPLDKRLSSRPTKSQKDANFIKIVS